MTCSQTCGTHLLTLLQFRDCLLPSHVVCWWRIPHHQIKLQTKSKETELFLKVVLFQFPRSFYSVGDKGHNMSRTFINPVLWREEIYFIIVLNSVLTKQNCSGILTQSKGHHTSNVLQTALLLLDINQKPNNASRPVSPSVPIHQA